MSVVAWCIYSLLHMEPDPSLQTFGGALVFVCLGVAGSRRRVQLGESTTHAMGSVAYVATVLLFPLPLAILTVGSSKVISELDLLRRKKVRIRHLAVNAGATILSWSIGGEAFRLLHGEPTLWRHDLFAVEAFPAVAALALLYWFTEAPIVVGAISLSNPGQTPWSIFQDVVAGTYRGEFSLLFVGIVFAVLCHFSPVISLFIIVPVIWSIQAFESVARLRKETIDSVLKMAESIDYRDTGTSDHSKRLADMARRLAKSLDLIPERVEEIVLAARVHDLGKIGISNEILLKDGPLTPEERTMMQDHPDIGATILSQYSAFKQSADIVRHHHERWDGKGYPDGLKGEEIPVGSRIISVVDAFDAMTADRTYREGMPVDAAVERLKSGIGSQFDPRICATFLQILIEDGRYIPREPITNLHLVASERNVG